MCYRGDVYGDALLGRVLRDTPLAEAYHAKGLGTFADIVVRFRQLPNVTQTSARISTDIIFGGFGHAADPFV